MGDKVGTHARGKIPGKVPTLWVTDAPQQSPLSHGLHFCACAPLFRKREKASSRQIATRCEQTVQARGELGECRTRQLIRNLTERNYE
jgi:hypothetical protein